jgi:hypothetical protein
VGSPQIGHSTCDSGTGPVRPVPPSREGSDMAWSAPGRGLEWGPLNSNACRACDKGARVRRSGIAPPRRGAGAGLRR